MRQVQCGLACRRNQGERVLAKLVIDVLAKVKTAMGSEENRQFTLRTLIAEDQNTLLNFFLSIFMLRDLTRCPTFT